MERVFLLVFLLGLPVDAASATKQAQLQSVEAQRPDIVIHGSYLAKIQVWAVPTGTGITPDEYVLIGHARRQTAAGQNERWFFEVDCGSLLATQVFVTAFDKKGRPVGTKSLPFTGASEINDALCGGR